MKTVLCLFCEDWNSDFIDIYIYIVQRDDDSKIPPKRWYQPTNLHSTKTQEK
jgi:hypothetical protein